MKRPHEFSGREEAGTQSEEREKKFRKKAFHAVLRVTEEEGLDDVAATELPFRRDEEETQDLLVNDAVRERDGQRTLALVADAGNGGIPHAILDETNEEKTTLSSSTSALVVMAFLSLWRK